MSIWTKIAANGTTTGLLWSAGEHWYRLAPGRGLYFLPHAAWCSACARFVPAERIESVERLVDQLREADYYAERPGLIPQDDLKTVRLVRGREGLKERLAWRRSRIAPPKCLICGSAALVSLNDETSEPQHLPGVGVVVVTQGLCSADRARHVFSPEGDRLS